MEFEYVDEEREAAEARVGQTFSGRWTLEKLLGMGGMAAVYAARSADGQQVALKVLHSHLSHRRDIRERFLREGLTANRVHHEGVVRVHGTEVDTDGSAVLVMELLEGESLGERHKRQALSHAELLHYLEQVLDALVVAHAAGIVHRDLKPDNLFVCRDGNVKILDFGIARVLDDVPQDKRTKTGMALGTVPFMAPEQALGKRDQIDGRVDVFALGAMAFRVLAGRNVHETESPTEQLVAMATKAAPKLSSLAPQVPEQLSLVIDLALAFAKEARYPDAKTMRDDVRALRAGQAPPFAVRRQRHREESTRVDHVPPVAPGFARATAAVAPRAEAATVVTTRGAAPATVLAEPSEALLCAAAGAHGKPTVVSRPSGALLIAAGAPSAADPTTAAAPNEDLLAAASNRLSATRIQAPNAALLAESRLSDGERAASSIGNGLVTRAAWWQAKDSRSRRLQLGAVAALLVFLGLVGIALAVGGSSEGDPSLDPSLQAEVLRDEPSGNEAAPGSVLATRERAAVPPPPASRSKSPTSSRTGNTSSSNNNANTTPASLGTRVASSKSLVSIGSERDRDGKAPEKEQKAPEKEQVAPEKEQVAPEKEQKAPEKEQKAPEKEQKAPEKEQVAPEKEQKAPEKKGKARQKAKERSPKRRE